MIDPHLQSPPNGSNDRDDFAGEGVNRRLFIGVGLSGVALLALGSAGYLALRSGKAVEAPTDLQVLDPAVYPVMAALVETVVPHSIYSVEELVKRVDSKLSYADPAVANEIHLGLGLLENALGGLLTRGRARPFSLLSVEERADALFRWRDSSIPLLNFAYHGIRKLVLAAYYSDEKAAMEIGYPGAFYEKPSPGPITPRGRLSEPYVPPQATPAEVEPGNE